MGINELIAQGAQPIGRDIPNVLNALERRKQQQFQNAMMMRNQGLAEQEAAAGQQEKRTTEEAKQAYAEASYIDNIPDEQLIPFVQQNLPHVSQAMQRAGISDVAGLRNLARGVKAKAGAMLGKVQEVDQEKFGAPVAGVAGGQNAFMRFGDKGGRQVVEGFSPPPRSGISMTTPDGSVIQVGGDPNARAGSVSLGKPTQSKLEQAFSDAQANSMALSQQMAKWKPEFSTYAGQVRAAAGNVADKMGASLPQEQKQSLLDYNAWKSDTAGLLSAYLNQLSGAAISPAEEKRLRAAFPNDEDGPSQYQAKAFATLKRFALVQARAAYLLSHPDLKLDSISIEGMETVILTEANKLAKAMQARGASPEEARAQAVAQTKARYGLGQ
ncbi:hypothetical protein [Caudoviricetes sp.]|nr:hypothetical protein [Caudoviricetes sp.]